jgi:hypothetical protein
LIVWSRLCENPDDKPSKELLAAFSPYVQKCDALLDALKEFARKEFQ